MPESSGDRRNLWVRDRHPAKPAQTSRKDGFPLSQSLHLLPHWGTVGSSKAELPVLLWDDMRCIGPVTARTGKKKSLRGWLELHSSGKTICPLYSHSQESVARLGWGERHGPDLGTQRGAQASAKGAASNQEHSPLASTGHKGSLSGNSCVLGCRLWTSPA